MHSGDPSLYGAIAEQIRRLDALGIPWTITPGVPAFAAAAAALGGELTLPGRRPVGRRHPHGRARLGHARRARASAAFAATGATLCIHLSINNLALIVRELTPLLGADMPVAVVYRATWPDQRIIRGTLADIRGQVKAAGITRTALIMVGRVLGEAGFAESRLYAADHSHVLRPRTPASQASASGAGARGARRRLRPGQHHDRQPQRARRLDLGVGQLAAARLDRTAPRPRAGATAPPRPRPGTAAGR